MNFFTLIRRSARYHARSHFGLLLGAIIASSVLIGALLVGDSVRESLHDLALARLGTVTTALNANDRLFRAELAANFDTTNHPATAILQLPGTAATPDSSARANQVQIIGVAPTFWALAQASNCFDALAGDGVILSQALAQQLHAQIGDPIILRVQKPSLLSRDALISPQDDLSIALRLNVDAIASDAQFGRFGLTASQVAPLNAFVDLKRLQAAVGQTNRANVLLTTEPSPDSADQKLSAQWQLADAELSLRSLPDNGGTELRSRRVFIDPAVVAAARQFCPQVSSLLTYFVNDLRSGPFATPYSMVCAAGAPLVPADLRDDEILINDWLAEDLQAKAGENVTLIYDTIGTGRALTEAERTFRIRGTVPLSGATGDPGLMPDFPGIAEAESSSDWDAGIPLQMKRIRPRDEQYWKVHRGTPKAFITLNAGQQMWTNRFGDATALRFPPAAGSAAEIGKKLLATLSPASVGLAFQPVRAQALAASAQAVDFGGLFLGFSLFLIVAALLLMALLFQFGIEKRTTEIGTLLALGFLPKQVRRLFLGEGIVIALIGASLGAALATVYARAMIFGLATIWRSAVGTSALAYHAKGESLVGGIVASVIISSLTLWLALRRQAKRPARELLAGMETASRSPRKKSRGIWIGVITGGFALALIGQAWRTGNTTDAETFFYSGALFLIGGLGFASAWLGHLGKPASDNNAKEFSLTIAGLGRRSCGRRRSRSLATMGLLASGVFLIVAIGAFRLDANQSAGDRASGTGGFQFIGSSTLPITQNLNTRTGRAAYGLDVPLLQKARVVPFRVHDGDEASCLNLNRAQQPRLLGVNAEALSQRKAFRFAAMEKGYTNDWLALKPTVTTNAIAAIPAIGDENSILWAMGKKVGDLVDYRDEQGRPFQVRIVGAVANSILQGSLIIDEAEFIKRFPNESGYRMFLVDAASNNRELPDLLSRTFQNVGLEITSTADRLNAFNAVQNTYLSTFQILGGLGLLLGSAGLGVVVLRTVQERRSELGLLAAAGFTRRNLQWLVLSEHAALLAAGVIIGAVAAFAAVIPALFAPGARVPYFTLAITGLAVWLNGLLWTWWATRMALRGKLTAALRNE